MQIDPWCVFCKEEIEDHAHVFITCSLHTEYGRNMQMAKHPMPLQGNGNMVTQSSEQKVGSSTEKTQMYSNRSCSLQCVVPKKPSGIQEGTRQQPRGD